MSLTLLRFGAAYNSGGGFIPVPDFLTYTHTWENNAQIQSNQAEFDGTDDQIAITPTGDIEDVFIGSNDFTIEMNLQTDVNQTQGFFGIGNGAGGWAPGTTNGHLITVFEFSGSIYFQWDNSGVESLNGTGSFSSALTNLIIIRDSGRLSIYVDGSRVATTTTSTSIAKGATTGTTEVLIGNLAPRDVDMDGSVEDMRISTSARYDATLTTITPLTLTNDANTIYLNTFTGANGSTPILNTEL